MDVGQGGPDLTLLIQFNSVPSVTSLGTDLTSGVSGGDGGVNWCDDSSGGSTSSVFDILWTAKDKNNGDHNVKIRNSLQ